MAWRIGLLYAVAFPAAILTLGLHPAYSQGPEQARASMRDNPSTAPSPVTASGALDSYGDPLPPGATGRVGGTMRFWLPYGAITLLEADGGRVLVAYADQRVQLLDSRSGKRIRSRDIFDGFIPGGFVGLLNDRWLVLHVVLPAGLMRAQWQGEIQVWDLAKRQEANSFVIDLESPAAALGGETPKLVSFTLTEKEKTYRVRDVLTGKLRCEWRTDRQDNGQVSPDGRHYFHTVAGRTEYRLQATDTSTGREAWSVAAPPHHQLSPFDRLCFSPDGKSAAFTTILDEKVSLNLHRIADGKFLWKLPLKRRCAEMAFSGDGRRMAVTFCDGGGLMLVDVAAGKEIANLLPGPTAGAGQPQFSRDGRTLAAYDGRGLRLWDLERMRELPTPPKDREFRLSADGKRLYLLGHRAIVVWDVAAGKTITSGLTEQVAWVHALPNGLLALGTYGTLTLCDVRTGQICRTFPETYEARFSSSGEYFCSGDRITSVKTGKSVRLSSTDRSTGIASPDGTLVAFGHHNRHLGHAQPPEPPEKLEVCDAQTGKLLWSRKEKAEGLVFMPDGKTLAVLDDTSKLVDARTGKVLRELSLSKGPGFVWLSPDGRDLIYIDRQLEYYPDRLTHDPNWEPPPDTIRIVDLATGRKCMEFVPGPRQLFFSPDFRLVTDGRKLWDVASQELIGELPSSDEAPQSVSILPDGRSYVTVCREDLWATVWTLDVRDWPGRHESLDDLNLPQLWKKLGGPAPQAYAAMWAIVHKGDAGVEFLSGVVAPVKPVDAKTVATLVAQLDSDHYAAREEASRKLIALGQAVLPALEAPHKEASPEVRQRAAAILAAIHTRSTFLPQPGGLAADRAVMALERVGTPRALALLKKLALGEPTAGLTIAAGQALKRATRTSEASSLPAPATAP